MGSHQRDYSAVSIPASSSPLSHRSSSVSKPSLNRSVVSRFNSNARLARSLSVSQSNPPAAGTSQFSGTSSGNNEFTVGSFTNTRDEIRDGSARLASLSMSMSYSAEPWVSPVAEAEDEARATFGQLSEPASYQTFSKSGLSLNKPELGSVPSGAELSTEDLTRAGASGQPTASSSPSDVSTPILSPPVPLVPESSEAEPSLASLRSGEPPIRSGNRPPVPLQPVYVPVESDIEEVEESSESTPLLLKPSKSFRDYRTLRDTVKVHLKTLNVREVAREATSAVPAVILGVLMNILDGVSYGMIMFPTNLAPFATFGGIGVSMFFVSCIVSQLVYTLGGSIFKGGNGSMMIEVVPFFHIIATIITTSARTEANIVPTTMLAFALSSVLTGLAFLALGAARLGRLSEFFPRHILVGCIGGVGAFLMVTGFQVSAGLEGSEDAPAVPLFRAILVYLTPSIIPLWLTPLVLAVALKAITSRYSHPFIFPGYFLAIPAVFYLISMAILRIPLSTLRAAGWVFAVEGVDSRWYDPWLLFSLRQTDWHALMDTIPTQLALVFFGLLHVPINVPALGISIGEDHVDTDRELVAHGISNIASGFAGSVPNYLCYVNSVLFYKLGGTTRVSSFLLAMACVGVLIAGPGVIGFLPVCVVGALIYILGIDLVKEAVWDTRGRVSRVEYATIWVIVITMTLYDFVIGIAVGVIMACCSFVFWGSQRRAIRSTLSGEVAKSTVRRHPLQNAFLKRVGRKLCVIRLQGFLFFGTIAGCETEIRRVIATNATLRFLVLDFAHASGVDFSAAEAFVRIHRLLETRDITLVLCGCDAASSVGRALSQVGLWPDPDAGSTSVVIFESLNDAVEHCENSFLRELYSDMHQRSPAVSTSIPQSAPGTSLALASSPQSLRGLQLLREAGEKRSGAPQAAGYGSAAPHLSGLGSSASPLPANVAQPVPLLFQALSPFSHRVDHDICFKLGQYFKRRTFSHDERIWSIGDPSDGVYVIESGVLRATYLYPSSNELSGDHEITECMLAGTLAGEMSFLSRTPRNTNVTAERDVVLWQLTIEKHDEMNQKEGYQFSRIFEDVLMRIALEEHDILMNYFISNL